MEELTAEKGMRERALTSLFLSLSCRQHRIIYSTKLNNAFPVIAFRSSFPHQGRHFAHPLSVFPHHPFNPSPSHHLAFLQRLPYVCITLRYVIACRMEARISCFYEFQNIFDAASIYAEQRNSRPDSQQIHECSSNLDNKYKKPSFWIKWLIIGSKPEVLVQFMKASFH